MKLLNIMVLIKVSLCRNAWHNLSHDSDLSLGAGFSIY